MSRTHTIDEPARYPLRFICPRECPSSRTVHCVGTDDVDASNGPHLRCDFCGKYMPTEDCLDLAPEDEL